MNPEGGGVDSDVQTPSACGVIEGSLSRWIVEVRDAGGGARADNFADVEGVMACVVAGDDGAAERVTCAFPKTSVAERVVASVLVCDHGHDKLDEVILTGLVEIGVPEVSSVSSGALVKFGGGIGGLRVARNDGWQEDRGIVEAVMRSCDELLFDSLRR